MRSWRIIVVTLPALLSVLSAEALAFQFVVLPKTTDLLSPDGRFAVRSTDSAARIQTSLASSTRFGFSMYRLDDPANSATTLVSPSPHGRAMIGS
jgi:hypothetical protein